MNEIRAHILRVYPPTRCFAVASWGAAATHWLARSLNSHSEILCLHAGNTFASAFGNAKFSCDADYLEMIASMGSSFALAGDVHGISRFSIPEAKTRFGQRFRAVIVVREPIARLHSHMSHMKAVGRGPSSDDYIRSLAAEAEQDFEALSEFQRQFLHAAGMLNAIVDESDRAPIFRSEDLTSDPRALNGLVEAISGGTLGPDHRWAEAAIGRGRLNQHAKSLTTLDQWEKQILRSLIWRKSWEAYEALGYPNPDWI